MNGRVTKSLEKNSMEEETVQCAWCHRNVKVEMTIRIGDENYCDYHDDTI